METYFDLFIMITYSQLFQMERQLISNYEDSVVLQWRHNERDGDFNHRPLD